MIIKEYYNDFDYERELVDEIANKLRLTKHEKENFIHDINNLRGIEWVEDIKECCPECLDSFKLIAEIYDENFNESLKEEYSDNKDYSVSVILGEAIECYYVFADSADEAEMEAVDLAFDDLSVLYIDDEGTGYYVELLLAGQTTGIGYTVNAFNEADAEEKAKQMAADDFYTQINY